MSKKSKNPVQTEPIYYPTLELGAYEEITPALPLKITKRAKEYKTCLLCNGKYFKDTAIFCSETCFLDFCRRIDTIDSVSPRLRSILVKHHLIPDPDQTLLYMPSDDNP
jgi:hypothetical protein